MQLKSEAYPPTMIGSVIRHARTELKIVDVSFLFIFFFYFYFFFFFYLFFVSGASFSL